MPEKVKPIPEGYRSITAYLIVQGASKAIDYYTKAFGAKERFRMAMPGGRVGHAELEIGESVLMLADEHPEMGYFGPESEKRPPVSLLLYVEDCDDVFDRAVSGGATVIRPLENQFYGDRNGVLKDPFGHIWSIASHVEDVSPEEMEKRERALAAKKEA
jgi:PhnB protein